MNRTLTSVVSNLGYAMVSLALAACLLSITAFFLYYRDGNQKLFSIGKKSFHLVTGVAVV